MRRQKTEHKMVLWTPIILAIIGAIITPIVIIIAVRQSQLLKKSDIPANSVIALNFSRTAFTNGHSILAIKDEHINKNDTVTLTGQALDIKQGENEKIPADDCLVVHKEDITRSLPLGGKRQLIIFQPRTQLDLPKELRGTTLGKNLGEKGQDSWLIKGVADMVIHGDLSIAQLTKMMNRGNLSNEAIKKFTEDLETMINLNALKRNEEDEKKKKTDE